MKLTLVAGARPNFMKIAPLIHVIHQRQKEGHDLYYRLVHTGQHYDRVMSQTFFEELNIPKPDINLECGGGTQAEQTAAILIAFEKELQNNPADLVIVVGDVNSTMACTIVAKKLQTKVAHIEAGIRSWDMSMPEEINRMVTDILADYYFTTSEIANENLQKYGAREEQIFFVGNVMIDTLLANLPRLQKPDFFDSLDLQKGKYLVLTMHRPANVDEAKKLKALMTQILDHVQNHPVIFPIHPRTARVFDELGIQADHLHTVPPIGYLEFNYLVKNSLAVLTDSGGITEETTVMGIPCMTLRDNTERPETITIGTNELVGTDPEAIPPFLDRLFAGDWKKGGVTEKWDGKTAERIIDEILSWK